MTDHAAVIRTALSLSTSTTDAHAALDALLAERDAAVKERDELEALCHDADAETMLYVKRAEAAEATLTRYRNALETLHDLAREHFDTLDPEQVGDIARAALDDPKEGTP